MGCPSDSPDDYTALQELKAKPKLREKFHVQDSWVEYDVRTHSPASFSMKRKTNTNDTNNHNIRVICTQLQCCLFFFRVNQS